MRRTLATELSIVLLLAGVALAVRVYGLTEVPPGLFYDEAANGLDVLDVLAGQHPVLFERNSGREPFFIYLQAVSAALLGLTPFALRLTSAICGAATVVAVYWMVREVFAGTAENPRWLALWTALFVATSYWHLTFSRLGFRVITLPLVACLTFAWFWRIRRRMEQRKRLLWVDLAVCGVLVGGSLYTYTGSRMIPLLLAAVAVAGALAPGVSPAELRRQLVALAVVGVVALAVFLPLGSYYLGHPAVFAGRVLDVSILNPEYNQGSPVAALATSTWETIRMFFASGDPNWRHNPAGRPVLDPILAAWLTAGVILALRRRSLPHLFPLVWLAAFAMPALLTADGPPNSLRGLGMVPATYLLPVLAMAAAAKRLTPRLPRLALWLPLPFLLFSSVTNVQDYFGAWQLHPQELRLAFTTPLQDEVEAVAKRDGAKGLWVWPLSPNYPAPHAASDIGFLYRGLAAPSLVSVDEKMGSEQMQALANGHDRVYLVHWRDTALLPDAPYVFGDPKHLLGFLLHKHGRLLAERDVHEVPYSTYELPASPQFQAAGATAALDVSFGGVVSLTGLSYGHTATSRQQAAADLDAKSLPAGWTAWVVLRWKALTPLDRDLKTTLYLADRAGHVAGQVDDLLVSDRYPAGPAWQAGEAASTYHILPTLAAIPPGWYDLYLGVYEPRAMRRYPVVDPSGAAGGTALRLGALEITRSLTAPVVTPARLSPAASPLAPGLALLGYDLPVATTSPGERLSVTLYWQAGSIALPDYLVGVDLRDAKGQLVAHSLARPGGDDYPTTAWQTGELLRDWHDLEIPAALPTGEYDLVVTAGTAGVTLGQVTLDRVAVAGRAHSFSPPQVGHPMDLRIGDQIAFRGYDLGADSLRPGETLQLTLHWQAIGEPGGDYTVFAQLLDGSSVLQAQQDGRPCQGACPTNGWLPGEYLRDPCSITLRADLPPGRYALVVGMYTSATGQRLVVRDGQGNRQPDDRMVLATVTVR